MTPIRQMLLAIAAIPEPDRLIMFEQASAETDPIALTLLVGRFAIARAAAGSVVSADLQDALDLLGTELAALDEEEP